MRPGSRAGPGERASVPVTRTRPPRRNLAAGSDGRIVGVPSAVSGSSAAAALLSLYDDAVVEVYGYLYARCRNRADAEDVTSEVFMGAVDAVQRGEPDVTTA